MYEVDRIQLQSLHHKTHVAELWHGKQGCYQELTLQERAEILKKVKSLAAEMGLHKQEAALNIAMPAFDLVWPAAALLAWKQGLRLHLAICVGGPEDPCAQFLRTGCLAANQSEKVREAAAVILGTIGIDAAAAAVSRGEEIRLDDGQLRAMNEMVGVDIVSDSRAENYVRKISEMCEYVIHPETGRIYTGLQDYRVVWAESTPSIILALHDPREAAQRVCTLLKLEDDAALEAAITGGRKRFEEY